MKALFDSDILIDFLVGETQAEAELKRFTERLISIVTWSEVMIGADSEDEQTQCREFLAAFTVIPFDQTIAEEAVRIRRATQIKLPDAIIWASAKANGALLVTRNTKDFPTDDPCVRIPYSV
ncbi:MAG: PIN domain-containing protein [Limisphaerales bacterium]